MSRRRRSARKHDPSSPSRARGARLIEPLRPAFRSDAAPTLLVVLLAFVAYANAFPNALVYDDKYFLTAERFSGLGSMDLLRFFAEDIWAGYGTESGLYRPLFAVLVALQWMLFGEWATGYHLVNIALHAVISAGVYRLVRQLLGPAPAEAAGPRLCAFLAAAVFAVHPVHAEAVNSVFNASELWASVGAVGGLLWLLKHLDARPVRAWTGLALIYLAALLTRETAVVLPTLAALLVLVYRPGAWPTRLRRALPVVGLVVPLGIYFALRIFALGQDEVGEQPASGLAGIAGQALGHRPGALLSPERMGGWLQSWFVSLKLWLWPHPLRLQHPIDQVSLWLASGVQLALGAGAVYLLARKRPAAFTGLAFFYLTLFPATLFMGRYGATIGLQERFLYLPSIGLSLLLAAALWWLARSRGPQLPAALALAVLLVLTPLTWARNADWSDNLRLFESDYALSGPRPPLLGLIVLNQIMEGKFSQAARYCDQHAELWPRSGKFAESCGQAYDVLGRLDDAERALLIATEGLGTKASAQQLLGFLYVRTGQPEKALEHFELAIRKEKVAAMRALRRAQMLYALYPEDPGRRREALAQVERALELQPRMIQALQLREKLQAAAGRR